MTRQVLLPYMLFGLVFCAMHFYVFMRLVSFWGYAFPWYGTLMVLFYVASFFLMHSLNENLHTDWTIRIMPVFHYGLGWILLSLPFLLSCDVVLLSTKGLGYLGIISTSWQNQVEYALPRIVFLGINICFIVGLVRFHAPIVVNHFTIESDRVTRPYQFVHISDLQFGSMRNAHVRKLKKTLVRVIKEEKINFILNTGDYVDSANYTADDLEPLSLKEFPSIKKFFSLGNHEFYHGLDKILNVTKEQGYHLLREEAISVDEINIIGIDDSTDKNQVKNILHQFPHVVKNDKFNILMYHRPVGVDDANKHGIQLMLSGHTHGGQFFPYSLFMNFLYQYPQGIFKKHHFSLYTTDGVGLWGPRLRLRSQNEIAVFLIKPK